MTVFAVLIALRLELDILYFLCVLTDEGKGERDKGNIHD